MVSLHNNDRGRPQSMDPTAQRVRRDSGEPHYRLALRPQRRPAPDSECGSCVSAAALTTALSWVVEGRSSSGRTFPHRRRSIRRRLCAVKVSISQPAYLPWLGYFHRISISDLHIILDTVQFEKNSFTNRNRIRTHDGPRWLTVPVRTTGLFGNLTIQDVEIADDHRWSKKHWATLEASYRGAPFFSEHAVFFQQVYRRPWTRLAGLSQAIVSYLLTSLRIDTPLIASSELHARGTKSDLLLNLCREVGATHYISGPMGRNYLEWNGFRQHGIEVCFHDYKHPTYRQVFPGFEPRMAAVDLLFNHGPESRAVLCSGPTCAS